VLQRVSEKLIGANTRNDTPDPLSPKSTGAGSRVSRAGQEVKGSALGEQIRLIHTIKLQSCFGPSLRLIRAYFEGDKPY